MSPPATTTTTTREIWVGESANLSSLRAGIQANSLNVALEQLLDESQAETVLLQVDSVHVNAVANDDTYNTFDDEDNDDDHDDDQNNYNTSNSASSFWRSMAHQPEIGVTGLLIVTTLRILFCSTTTTASPQSTTTTTTIPPSAPYDFSIDAGCINLHALTNEPKASVFLQVEHDNNNNNNNMDGEGEPVDITLIPSDESQCPLLFEALSKLVSLHPIVPDDDDEGDEDDGDDDGTSDLMTMMMMTSMPRQTMGLGEEEEMGDDDPSDVEREAMLRRLDHLLVVPPELEVDEGQFEDADEALL